MTALALSCWGTSAYAAGLGTIEVRSGIGQPLRVRIPLLGADAQEQEVRCIKANIESLDGAVLGTPRVELVRSRQSMFILLSTRQVLNEPALNISIRMGCELSIHREYQVLLDPVETPSVVQQVRQAHIAVDEELRPPLSQPQPDITPTETSAAKTRAAKKERKTRTKPAVTDTEKSSQPSSEIRPKARAKGDDAAKQAPRNILRLAPVDPPANVSAQSSQALPPETTPVSIAAHHAPPTPAETALQAPPESLQLNAAPALSPEVELVKSAHALMKTLQAEAEALRAESQRLKQQSLADKAAMEAAQQDLLNWVKTLVTLLILCTGAIGWLLWRIRAMKSDQSQLSWKALFTTQTARTVGPNTEHFPNTTLLSKLSQEDVQSANAPSAASQTSHTTVFPTTLLHDAQALKAETFPADKAEEISDVMELVEVWMKLNNPHKVIELLKPFSEVAQPRSPLPLLCLLDVYRALGDQAKYEAIHTQIKNLFNVKLAPWNEQAPIEPAKTLADFPHVTEKILSLWATNDIVPYLESLLLDNRDGTRSGFDLPAYRDILKLISLAKQPNRLKQSDRIMDDDAYAILFAPPSPRAAYPAQPTPAHPVDAPLTRDEASMHTHESHTASSNERASINLEFSSAHSLDTTSAPVAQDIPQPLGNAKTKLSIVQNITAAEKLGRSTPHHDDMSPMVVKLHLAIAYLDIGDKEGAYLLLDEVIQEGSAEQVEQAQAILAKIA